MMEQQVHGPNGGHRDGTRGKPGQGNRGGGGPRPPAVTAVSAPYNFVPHANFVFKPDWAQAVSHDLPFKDGLCGEIAYTLKAYTPLLVGGKQVRDNDRAPGEVSPWQDPDGTYAIPGASIKGMLRSVLEIAGFGRMRLVDDRKLSIRDLAPGVKWYHKQLAKARAGWLTMEDGNPQISPCEFVRIEQSELVRLAGCSDRKAWTQLRDKHHKRTDAETWGKYKYEHWDLAQRAVRFNVVKGKNSLNAVPSPAGAYHGTLVFTGQPSPKKHLEFVFHHERDASQSVAADVWRGFLQVHAESEDWKYWREQARVPVFYLMDEKGNVASLGLAMMYRLPYTLGIHDALANTSPEHLESPGKERGYDLADLLFGATNPYDQGDALGARVACVTARNTNHARTEGQSPTILNGPKPSFFPSYIRQPTKGEGGLDAQAGHDRPYATLMEQNAQLRGFKRYPARPQAKAQPLQGDQQKNKKVQVVLHPLASGAEFSGRVVFHNLKPVELGALLWTLTWGSKPELRHALGMGKSFGFGQAGITVDAAESCVAPNDPAQPTRILDAGAQQGFVAAFEACMEAVCAPHGGWLQSLQMANLVAMADPGNASRFATGGRALRHMTLDAGNGVNEFRDVKQRNAMVVLADYAVVTGHHVPLDPQRVISAKAAKRTTNEARRATVAAPARRVRADADFVPARAYKSSNARGFFIEVKGTAQLLTESTLAGFVEPLDAALRAAIEHADKAASVKVSIAFGDDDKTVVALRPRTTKQGFHT